MKTYCVKREYVDWEFNVTDWDIIDEFDSLTAAMECADSLNLYGDDQIGVFEKDEFGREIRIKIRIEF